MSKFLIKKLGILVIALFLSENSLSEEILIPKNRPDINLLIKKEIIIPKSEPKIQIVNKNEEILTSNNEVIEEETILPKKKDIPEKIKLTSEKKKYLLPQLIDIE